jgi:hypothetical protein
VNRSDRTKGPWIDVLPVKGERFWLLADEITARCLAAGIVTARFQVQAAQLTRHLDVTVPDDEQT